MINDKIKDIIEDEGLGYAVLDYLSPKEIDDPILARLWQSAQITLKQIEEYLDLGEMYG